MYFFLLLTSLLLYVEGEIRNSAIAVFPILLRFIFHHPSLKKKWGQIEKYDFFDITKIYKKNISSVITECVLTVKRRRPVGINSCHAWKQKTKSIFIDVLRSLFKLYTKKLYSGEKLEHFNFQYSPRSFKLYTTKLWSGERRTKRVPLTLPWLQKKE